MTDAGLVCGAGSVLARMSAPADRPARLALDADKDRLLAMLSVLAGELVPAAKVLHHVEAASAHWQRGDKALANLRLIVARLPRPSDFAAIDRLALSETLLDQGLAPASLMKALWPQPAAEELRRYNPDQPRVPAGHGVESGRWEFGSAGGGRKGRGADARVVVAVNPGGIKGESLEERELFEFRDELGEATPEQEFEHGRPIDPFSGLPMGVGPGPFARQSIPAGPTPRPTTPQQLEINRIGGENGCHTCGTKEPGTAKGNFVGDHQAPTSLVSPDTPQRYLPQCLRCSQSQGGLIKSFKAKQAPK